MRTHHFEDIRLNSLRIDSTFCRWAACCACSRSISVSSTLLGCCGCCCLGVRSPELLPGEADCFLSGIGTFFANSSAFSRFDLLFGVSTFCRPAVVPITACAAWTPGVQQLASLLHDNLCMAANAMHLCLACPCYDNAVTFGTAAQVAQVTYFADT